MIRLFAFALALLLALPPAWGAEPADVLSGTVSSVEEGAMEGVLVSAAQQDGIMTVTVTSDAHGRYRFPAGKLPPGPYELSIRAIGYTLAGPQKVTMGAGATTADLRLVHAPDLAAQLSNTEWLQSMPGADSDKKTLLECMSCHTLERVARSTHDRAGFVTVLNRMANYANNTTQLHPQLRVAKRTPQADLVDRAAAFLATVNLSATPHWTYPLKTLPRPTGRGTRAIITEYRLPRDTMAPHDLRQDANGIIWFSEFGDQALGAFDPKTGKVTEYPIPSHKSGFPTGTLDLEPDQGGKFWLALMFQTGLARFDPATKQMETFPIPAVLDSDAAQQSMVMPWASRVDGKVWTNMVNRHSIMRLDIKTGAYELIDPFPRDDGHLHSPYGMVVDPQNDLYFMDFDDQNIVRVDAATTAVTVYPTPTPGSRPRRGMMDAAGRIWFAEFAGNNIGMFDIKTTQFREWPAPTAWTAPYDAAIDKRGVVWSAGMNSDRVLRLDPVTGKMVEYLLPHQTNVRRLMIDNSTKLPTIWMGNNHHATIVKFEPQD